MPKQQVIENKAVVAVRQEAGGLVEKARGLTIQDSTGLEYATELLGFVAGAKKRLEEQRVFLVKPLNDHVRDINAKFKEWVKPLEVADSLVRGKVLDYQREQRRLADEARRREEEERARQEAEANDNSLLEGDDFPDTDAPATLVPLPPVAPKTISGVRGDMTTRQVWDFEVADETAIPRTFLVVNEKAIRAAVQAGVRDIPGVHIFQRESLAVRSR